MDNIWEEYLCVLELEILGKEEIIMLGIYIIECVFSFEGEIFINLFVGFGLIIVEVKIVEGVRVEEVGVEDKWESIVKLFYSNNKRLLKKKLWFYVILICWKLFVMYVFNRNDCFVKIGFKVLKMSWWVNFLINEIFFESINLNNMILIVFMK